MTAARSTPIKTPPTGFWRKLLGGLLKPVAATPKKKKRSRRSRAMMLQRLAAMMGPAKDAEPEKDAADIFGRAQPPAWIQKPQAVLAMDEERGKAIIAQDSVNLACNTAVVGWAESYGAISNGVAFLGYPYLAQLSLRPEFRSISEIIAKEMTRKWGRVTYSGKDPATDKITAIEAELKRLKIKAAFRRAAELDGFFGRAHMYFDIGQADDKELMTSIGNADALTRVKVPLNSFRGVKVIEPMWVYPASYNSTDPLADNYYRPEHWYVQAKTVHTTRLMPIVSREVSDMLKPAFAFGGLSLSQVALPYVENWLRTRQSVSDLIHSFTVFKLATDMDQLTQEDEDGEEGGGSGWNSEGLIARLELFNRTRDNRGVFLHDKETEDFANVEASLGSLDKLQAQSQEQQASVVQIPLVKLLGITPSGLNSSTDNELRCFYDRIEAQQEAVFTDPMQMVLVCIQLSLFGEVDAAIGFKFNPLWTMTKKEEADIRKVEAETDAILVNDVGAIDNMESRERVASDPETPYQLDMSKVIEQPEDDTSEDLSGNDLLTPEQRAAMEAEKKPELRKVA